MIQKEPVPTTRRLRRMSWQLLAIAFPYELCSLSRHIQRSPEIPCGDRSVGPPFFADGLQFLRLWQFLLPKCLRITFADAVVIDRPDIESPEVKEQEHLHRPPAN